MKLYHASLNKNLTQIEPQRTLSKNRYIGDFVFATKSYLYALMYLVPNEAGTKIMDDKGEPYIVINGSKAKFMKLDSGGAIYTLPGQTFEASPQVGLDDSELVSRQAVTPLAKETFGSSLKAMTDAGIAVYFLEDGDFDMVLKAGKRSRKVLADFTAINGLQNNY